MKRVLVSWSSGKDCAWALHLLRQQPDIEIVGLLTTINAEFDRVAMHGTRSAILEAQATAADLPLWNVPLPWPCSNEVYEQRMAETCRRAISEDIEAIAFGDLFLRDVRAYRENQLQSTGIEPLFPLWDMPTPELARSMIAGGLRAKARLCRFPPARSFLRWPGLRFRSASRSAFHRGSLWRTRRVSLLRLRRPHVLASHRARCRRNRQPRWLHLRRFQTSFKASATRLILTDRCLATRPAVQPTSTRMAESRCLCAAQPTPFVLTALHT